MQSIPDCFYRVSVKALILNEARDKFLLCQEASGWWELPGGGLDWGATPQEDLPREIKEEMGLETTWVAEHPSYFLTGESSQLDPAIWIVNVIYEATVTHLDITPSDECVAVRFVDKHEVDGLQLFAGPQTLLTMFDPTRHSK